MKSYNLIYRFNRGLKLGIQRFPLLVSFVALAASAASYLIALAPYGLLQGHVHFVGLQGLATALATFWIFLGMAICSRHYHAMANHQRLNAHMLLQGSMTIVRFATSFSSLFLVGAMLGWLALFLKQALLQIPYLGIALSIVFAWLPFVLFLLLKLLPFVIAAFLYLLVPMVSIERLPLRQACVKVIYTWRRRPIESILCTVAGLLPLILAAWLVSSLQHHTLVYLGVEDSGFVILLRRLVIALASAVVMSPAISLLATWGLESAQWLEQKTHENGPQ